MSRCLWVLSKYTFCIYIVILLSKYVVRGRSVWSFENKMWWLENQFEKNCPIIWLEVWSSSDSYTFLTADMDYMKLCVLKLRRVKMSLLLSVIKQNLVDWLKRTGQWTQADNNSFQFTSLSYNPQRTELIQQLPGRRVPCSL